MRELTTLENDGLSCVIYVVSLYSSSLPETGAPCWRASGCRATTEVVVAACPPPPPMIRRNSPDCWWSNWTSEFSLSNLSSVGKYSTIREPFHYFSWSNPGRRTCRNFSVAFPKNSILAFCHLPIKRDPSVRPKPNIRLPKNS